MMSYICFFFTMHPASQYNTSVSIPSKTAMQLTFYVIYIYQQ